MNNNLKNIFTHLSRNLVLLEIEISLAYAVARLRRPIGHGGRGIGHNHSKWRTEGVDSRIALSLV